jgi:hypothetical protein
MLVRDTRVSKARYVTAMPGVAMLATAEHRIKTIGMGWGCDVWYNVVVHKMHTHRHE